MVRDSQIVSSPTSVVVNYKSAFDSAWVGAGKIVWHSLIVSHPLVLSLILSLCLIQVGSALVIRYATH